MARVEDAGGRIVDDDGDHFASGRVEPIEPDWLTVEQMAVIAAAKRRARLFG